MWQSAHGMARCSPQEPVGLSERGCKPTQSWPCLCATPLPRPDPLPAARAGHSAQGEAVLRFHDAVSSFLFAHHEAMGFMRSRMTRV